MPAKSSLRLVTLTNQNRTVQPSRDTNASYRKREHLTPAEIEKLIEAAKGNRHAHRDATLIALVKRIGNGSKLLGFPIHFHMLRHSCGFAVANAGHDTRSIQDYLGHKAIQVRYTELAPTKFKSFWR
jgi:integrase